MLDGDLIFTVSLTNITLAILDEQDSKVAHVLGNILISSALHNENFQSLDDYKEKPTLS